MFLDPVPRFSNRGTRLMVHETQDVRSFIKFYGQRTEGLLQDKTILWMFDMEAYLVRRKPWKVSL